MPMQWSVAQISFRGGIDTKTDKKGVINAKLLDLNNGLLDKFGKIRKRAGFSLIAGTPGLTLDGATPPVETHVMTHGNQLSRMYTVAGTASDGGSVWSYSEAVGSYAQSDSGYAGLFVDPLYDIGSAFSTSTPGATTEGMQQVFHGGVAMNDNIIVYAWGGYAAAYAVTVEKDTGVQIDSFTGNGSFSNAATSYRDTEVKCVNLGGTLGIIYLTDNNTLDLIVIGSDGQFGTEAGGTLLTGVIDTANDGNGVPFDVGTQADGTGILAYATGSGVVATRFNSSGLISPNLTVVTETITNNGQTYPLALSVAQSTGEVQVAWTITAATVIRVAGCEADMSGTTFAATTVETLPSSGICHAIGMTQDTSQAGAYLYYTTEETNVPKIRQSVVSSLGAVSGTGYTVHGYRLASKPFLYKSDSGRMIFAMSERKGWEHYALIHEGQLAGCIYPNGNGKPTIDSADPSTIAQITVDPNNPEHFYLPLARTTGFFTDTDVAETTMTGVRVDLSHRPEQVEFSGATVLASGLLYHYDGNVGNLTNVSEGVTELGFLEGPDLVAADLTVSNGSTNILANNATYSFKLIYEWTDNNGRTYRSAPSETATVSTGASDDDVTVVARTLHLTRKSAKIVLYRTEDGGSVFYRDRTVDNDTTAYSVSFDAGIADANLTDNQTLYTTGGVLENVFPPPSKHIAVHNGRLWLYDGIGSVFFSKKEVSTLGIQFADDHVIAVDRDRGPYFPVGMDDKVVFLSPNEIDYISGDGPNTLGQGIFSPLRDVASSVGCTNQESIIETDLGIFFESDKGIYLLSRDLQTAYVGADVEGFRDRSIVSALLVEDLDQALFGLSDNKTVLVYDLQVRQWSTLTLPTSAQYVFKWRGRLAYLGKNGNVYRQSDTTYCDNGIPYPLTVGTAWLKMTGPQGFNRIRRFAVLGEKKDGHKLRVNVYYDYDDTVAQTVVFDAKQGIPAGKDVLQFRARLSRQKCESIRFEFEDIDTLGNGEGYSISDLTIEAAQKSGINRLGERQAL